MPYSPLMLKPFRDELTSIGIKELIIRSEVDQALDQDGTTLVVINSICNCAAVTARPGIRLALEKAGKKPTRSVSVFAGQDLEVTAYLRSYFSDIPPSSPSIALYKDKVLVFFIPKHRIEGRSAEMLAEDLKAVFDEYC